LTAVVLGVLCAAGMIFSVQLVAALAPGFDPEKAALTAQLTRIMFPFILLVSLAALVMGMLNSKSIFGMPAMASSFFNMGSIVGGVTLGFWIDPHFGPHALAGLALATVFGGALQLAVQLPSLARLGYRFRPDFRWRDAGVKAILLLMGPSVIAASTTQFNVLINSMFASTLGDGPIFWLSIAFRLMQLPLGVFGVALGTVTLPLLSRLVVAGQMTGFRAELARAMRLGLLLTVPSTVGLIMLAEPIISVLYQHGKFTAYQAAQAAGALRFYAIGLAGYAALKVLVNAFYALDKRKTPMLVSFFAVALNLLLNWIFTFRLGWGHRGLAFSTGCIATFNFLLLYMLMRRHLHGLESRRMLVMLAKVAVAAAALVAVCAASSHWLLADWATQAFLRKLGELLGTVIVGAAVFAGCGVALHIEELKELQRAVKRRLRRV
jgi:putative peptidoglycan lipid II flippase